MKHKLDIPRDRDDPVLDLDGRKVRLTNLSKVFWPDEGITKGDLLQFYADIAPALLPHLIHRAMVMKRYPHGIHGEFFFMKRTPSPHPEWLETCSIKHASGNVIAFPMIQDIAALLWVVNLGCIDLNPWYAQCANVNQPDYLHFDLDPGPPAGIEKVCEAALRVHEALNGMRMPNYAKTSGSKGIHVYVPIVCEPLQKEVWTFSKSLARKLAERFPELITAEYRIAKRPPGRVLVDYNQNAWGRTLASVYSIRPKSRAPVSTPLTWEEVEKGVRIEDFRMDNVRERIDKVGDLWKPLLAKRGRFDFLKAGLRTPEKIKPA